MKNILESRMENLTGWMENEGRASGDFENYLWACRPSNWERNDGTLSENDLTKLGGFNAEEINAAIDVLETKNNFESSKEA